MNSRTEAWLALAATAPSADNSQPWRFAVKALTLEVHYLQRQASSLFGCDAHATLLSIGGMAHILHTCGAEIEWRDCIHGAPYFAAKLPDTPPRDANRFFDRHTNRHPYKKGGVSMDSLRAIPLDTNGSTTRVDWIVDRTMIDTLATCVGEVSYQRFRSQAQHDSLMHSLRFTEEAVAQGDGLDIATLHLPPGGAQFMRWITPWQRAQSLHRFGAARFMAKAEQSAFRTCGAVCVISAPIDDESTLHAGETTIDVWTHLNAMHLAVQPWYVLSPGSFSHKLDAPIAGNDVDAAALSRSFTSVSRALSLPNNYRVHMAFRVGVAKQAPVRARRLPIDTLSRSL
jgi:hypothetical protein